jgi:hypothetical protein
MRPGSHFCCAIRNIFLLILNETICQNKEEEPHAEPLRRRQKKNKRASHKGTDTLRRLLAFRIAAEFVAVLVTLWFYEKILLRERLQLRITSSPSA